METENLKPAGQGRHPVFWALMALLAVGIVGGIVYVIMSLTHGTDLPETDAWARVGHFQASGEVDSLEAALNDYLWTFGDGRYSEQARTLRDRLYREREQWERVSADGCTLEAVDAFTYENPDGFFHQQALLLLDSLAFVDAKEQGTEEALMNYLEQHHDGRFADEVQVLLKDVGQSEASESEARQASATITDHFAAMQEGSEAIVATMADNVSSYIGKPNPQVSDILAYMSHFQRGSVEKVLAVSDFDVRKMLQGGEPSYRVQFVLKETIAPDDSAKTEVKLLNGTAILDASMLITSLVLEKMKN